MAIVYPLLFAVLVLIPVAPALQCYSCDTDTSDLDCDDLSIVAKTPCMAFSSDHPIIPICGYKRLQKDGATDEDRVWRGCTVAGECTLLGRQGNEAFGNGFSLTQCKECSEDNCNDNNLTPAAASLPGLKKAVWFTSFVAVVIMLDLW